MPSRHGKQLGFNRIKGNKYDSYNSVEKWARLLQYYKKIFGTTRIVLLEKEGSSSAPRIRVWEDGWSMSESDSKKLVVTT